MKGVKMYETLYWIAVGIISLILAVLTYRITPTTPWGKPVLLAGLVAGGFVFVAQNPAVVVLVVVGLVVAALW